MLRLMVSMMFGSCSGLRESAHFYSITFMEGCQMRPLSRGYVNKGRSAGKFRGQMRRTKAPNVSQGLMRGGWRL